MSRLKTKLSAFTILEVIIVMLLISVVMAMAYAVFFMVSSYEARMNINNESQNEYLLASAVFRTDIENADYLEIGADSSLMCILPQKNVDYRIINQLLIRTVDGQSDTLLREKEMQLSFEKIENREHPEFVESASVMLTDSLGKRTYLSGTKIYSSASLFKTYPDAGN